MSLFRYYYAPTVLPATYKAGVQGLSPVAYYPLDDASGNFADASGNGYTATANGDPTYKQTGPTIASVVQDAIDFDGTGDYATASADIDNSVSGEMTVSVWFNIPASAVAEDMVVKGDAGDKSWLVQLASDGVAYFYTYQTDGSTIHGFAGATGAVDDGTWHHLVAWIDSNGYINIDRDNGTTGQDTTVSGTWNGPCTDALVLAALNSSGSSEMTGKLAHVAYWDSDIGATDRTKLYTGSF